MVCRYRGHEQNGGKFCDVCGKPMGVPAYVSGGTRVRPRAYGNEASSTLNMLREYDP